MLPSQATDARRLKRLAILLVIGGALGLLAAADLLIEKIAMLQDPFYVPSCSISAVLSCGSVMLSSASEAFGFPNPIIGLVAFPVVITTGVVLLAGAELPRWYWRGLQVGVTFGVVFVHWLIFQTLYRIGALCPYCMVVWLVTIPIFLFVTLRNFAAGAIPAPGPFGPAVTVLDEYRGVILTVWYIVILAAAALRFRDDWASVLP